MQLRCTVQLDGVSRKLILVSQENETPEHLGLKLAAFVLFFKQNPLAEISSKNPAVSGQEFKPDLLVLNPAGEIAVWVECGNVTMNKLDKLIRRNREARIVVLKENRREAENLRRVLGKNEISHAHRIEIFCFPGEKFQEWMGSLEESTEIVGEAHDRSFNLVSNAVPLNFDFESVP